MNEKYFMMDDYDLQDLIKAAELKVEEQKLQEESKADKKWEQDILSGLHIN